MNNRCSIRTLVLFLVGCAFVLPAAGQSQLELEFGLVTPGYNDVRIPGDTGTRFSLTDDLDAEDTTAFRLRYGHTFNQRHWVAVLAAPLTVESSGTLDTDVDFDGTTFPAGSTIDATFRFDSYRLIYRYLVHESEDLKLSLGGALKVRDAAIKLRSAESAAENANTGVVPLLSMNLTWMPFEKVHFVVDGEALVAPQGRAEDLLFAVQYVATEHLAFNTGYRLLEGGADNDEVYTFSLFHYAVVGTTWSF